MSHQSSTNPHYVLFSDNKNTITSVKTIDPKRANLPPRKGGLNWRFIKSIHLGRNFLWQRGVVKLAFSKEFDTIIYLGVVYHLSTWVSCFFARLMRKRTLMWSHGFLRNEKGLKGWVRTCFYRLADGMLLFGNHAREIMISKGFAPEKLYVIYNSLDYDRQCKIRENITQEQLAGLRRKLFNKPGLPVLLWIGRLTPQKKLDMVLKAAKILKDDGNECNVLFIGDGTEKQNLLDMSHELGLNDNVHFRGACYDEEEIGPLISLCDICIAPGEVGLTCMHSLVYGTPVITHDEPDYQGPEYEAIIPGKNGAFFERGNVESLARTIKEWLSGAVCREEVASDCQEVIDRHYNPHFQLSVINAAVLAKSLKDTGVMKRAVKKIIASADYSIASVLSQLLSERGQLIMVVFHSIFLNEDEVSANLIAPQQGVRITHFERFLKHFLGREYVFVSPVDIQRGLDHRKNYILVTFDDGYYNNTRVLPLLKTYSVPAVFFISTSHILEGKCFWWDVVHRERIRQGLSDRAICSERRFLNTQKNHQIEEYIMNEFGPESLRPMGDMDRPFTPSELKSFAAEKLVHIGNHTHEHAILTNYDSAETRFQLLQCQNTIRDIIGKEPIMVSYPNGYYNSKVLEATQQAGFRLGVSLKPFTNRLSHKGDMLQLGRYILWGNDEIEKQCAVFCSKFSLQHSLQRMYKQVWYKYKRLAHPIKFV